MIMGFDILQASKNITEKYIRYLKTVFDIDDPTYKKLFNQEINNIGSFSKGPYLDVVDSFESGMKVQDLIDDGILSKDFKYIPDIYSKTLYKHQEISVKKLSEGKNVVVSTGTGSGKTESFLVPIINSLMKEKEEKGTITPGVRALLIYPMNALANDQISRLRSVLANYPSITFGAYTGQTPEGEERALERYKALNNGSKPLKNEIISRSRMKDTPPNILITNYSMLEYLMLRPKDNSFFQGQHSHNWRFVVLDEAHTYSGSTGIEVSMLLRRLKAYLQDSDIRYILTSATLGGEKTNNEVAQFASNLCDAPFSSEDIIRAHRIKLTRDSENGICLGTADYIEMNDIVESGYSDEKILDMLKNYTKTELDSKDFYEYLFDYLLRDETFWKVKRFLASPKTVAELCKAVNWSEKEVSAFVNVASKAVKNRKTLFDARYHMFVRATEGVFVTLGDHKELSLTRQNTKFVNDKEYKFFEIVTCSQCHAIYLLGAIETDEKGVDHLVQKTNLGGENIREAFLIGDKVNDDDDDAKLEDQNLKVRGYELCPHCGFIRDTNMVHKTHCKHDENSYIKLIKVSQSERTGRVTKCIKCEGTNNTGILRSFFSGQEASTSVIGTALFEELPNKEIKITTQVDEDDGFDDGFGDGFGDPVEKIETVSKAKQFIAFSDNRQAAAFFATYFYGTYQGLLYSRVVYDNIKKLPDEGKPLTNFVKDMSMDFRNHKIADMYDGNPDYLKESWKAIMKELIQSYARNSLIGLGLMKVDFNDDIQIPPNGKFKLSSDDVKNICLVLMRSMFEDNAIYHGQNFTDADIAFYSNNNVTNTYVLANPKNKYIKSFVPKNDHSTNKRLDYLQRVFEAKGIEIERDQMIQFLTAIWSKILEPKGVLKDNSDFSGKRIDISKLKVAKKTKWYRCSKCHRITPYNVDDVCPAYKCEGKLEEIDIGSLEKENHYYRIYNDLDEQPLRVVEHTAQLSSEEAYKLQDKFKRQEIDVLSCSTTFEMGVDIGDLETVFMRNMPPTPSNYVQRAGRAGRSTKSAALALTFCNKSNHDFNYFTNPVSMISGEIQPPLFKVENEKIGIRHLYSAALSFFWRLHPEYFGQIKDFFGENGDNEGYVSFKNYVYSKPKELKDYLLCAFPDQLVDKLKIKDFGWADWLFGNPDPSYPNLTAVYNQYYSEVKSLYDEKARLEAENRSNGSIIYRINTYTKENVISFLSRGNILPKYGFPVDTVELQINTNKDDNRSFGIDLSRDLSMAISEYAPGCEIVAAGKLIRSRYIKKMPNKSWRLYDYVKCDCNTLNIDIHHDVKDGKGLSKCSRCGKKFQPSEIKTFLIPEFGFASENKIEKPTLIKPDKTFRTEASMVNFGTVTKNEKYAFGEVTVDTTSMEDGEIAILNSSDFYVCPNCGYSLGEFEVPTFTSSITKEHKNLVGHNCKNTKLFKYSIGYRFKTDAMLMSLNENYTYEQAYSILQAIVLAACETLNIDNNEIAGCLQYSVTAFGGTFDFVVYDTTPGGAGHVKRFSDKDILEKILKRAYHKANNCTCGGETGYSSCYNCLRTYQNQHYHDIIKRKHVIEGLKKILGTNAVAVGPKPQPKKKYKLTFTNYTDESGGTYEYIVGLLGLDEEEGNGLLSIMVNNNLAKPKYSYADFELANGKEGYADLEWPDKKVLLFDEKNKGYEVALESDYKCFILGKEFDSVEFFKVLK